MIVKSIDGIEVDITHCDAGYPPNSPTKNPILNTTACWFKPGNEEWIRSRYRSAMVTADVVKRNKAEALRGLLGDTELKDEGSKGSGTGNSAADAPKL